VQYVLQAGTLLAMAQSAAPVKLEQLTSTSQQLRLA